MNVFRWLSRLSDALASARSSDEALESLSDHLAEQMDAGASASLRRDGSGYRCLSSCGFEATFRVGGFTSEADIVRFLGTGTVERLKSVRAVQEATGVRLVADLRSGAQRFGAVVLERKAFVAADDLEALALAVRMAELACAAISVPHSSAPADADRSAEHWEAIGRLTSTVLHELGNPVAFAALAASQLAQLASVAAGDPSAAKRGKALAEDLALSVGQMAELLAELRRVSRGPEGARFLEPRAIVEGAVRLAHAELRGLPSITAEVGDLPLVSGRAGSLGAGFAHLFSTVLRGHGGALTVRGHVEGGDVVLVVEGFDFRMPRASNAVRIVRGLARSAKGRAELMSEGALVIHLPTVSDAAPPSSKHQLARPSLLVVDDEAALARALAAALAGTFEVEIATSADEALARVQQRAFDAVLCDVHLEGESGLTLYERVIARVPALEGRFALASGGTDAATEERARARGLPILVKPFDWAELERELGRLLVRAQSGTPIT